jgi:hypothetical protein
MRRRDIIILFGGVAAGYGDIAMATEESAAIAKEASSDLASVLASEFVVWFEALGAKGVLPRAFTGVTQGGKQAVVVLTGLPIDRIQRRDFLIWLCRNEEFTAYAYATQVGVADDKLSGFTEALDIYASSDRYDVSQTLSIDRQANGAIQFLSQHHAVLQAKDGNGVFFGLQRSDKTIPSSSDGLFQDLWRDLKSKAMWRQR